jgi:hypothetical protein
MPTSLRHRSNSFVTKLIRNLLNFRERKFFEIGWDFDLVEERSLGHEIFMKFY